mmetsp:Transcript_100091/g.282506  ORF Transcript_100091/g.282506 Transcript_100091/m.282506 type:complete len:210 (+) Transcript_100091:163-792(+)
MLRTLVTTAFFLNGPWPSIGFCAAASTRKTPGQEELRCPDRHRSCAEGQKERLECWSDDDCGKSGLCCNTSCGRACLRRNGARRGADNRHGRPELVPEIPCAIKITMTTRDKSDADGLLDAVPTPVKHYFFENSGILGLVYGSHQRVLCCKAKEIFERSSIVASIEFDGPVGCHVDGATKHRKVFTPELDEDRSLERQRELRRLHGLET